MNMLVLWWLAACWSPELGGVRFLLVYAVALLGGSLGALLLDPNAFTAGASGAVFGLGGAVVVAERASRFNRQGSGVLGFLVINIVISLSIPGISLGGARGGAGCWGRWRRECCGASATGPLSCGWRRRLAPCACYRS